MANGQVDTITEAYWISLQIGTTTIQGKFHHLPHLPSDLVLGIDLLRRYPFSIDLKEGSASLRPPTATDEVQPTQPQPAFRLVTARHLLFPQMKSSAFGSSSRKNSPCLTASED
jgi:hypothetical protein